MLYEVITGFAVDLGWADQLIALSGGGAQVQGESQGDIEQSAGSGLLKEKSRFFKEEGRWLYADGVFD